MGKYKRIPVVKHRVVIPATNRQPRFRWIMIILLGFGLMIFYVWLKVQINNQLGEIQILENEYRQLMAETEKLQAEETRLSSFARIQILATKRGFIFPPPEDIHELP